MRIALKFSIVRLLMLCLSFRVNTPSFNQLLTAYDHLCFFRWLYRYPFTGRVCVRTKCCHYAISHLFKQVTKNLTRTTDQPGCSTVRGREYPPASRYENPSYATIAMGQDRWLLCCLIMVHHYPQPPAIIAISIDLPWHQPFHHYRLSWLSIH